jgi:hypothetical protein
MEVVLERIEEWFHGLSSEEMGRSHGGDAMQADGPARMLECHGASRQVPHDVPQWCHPIGAQHHVIACKGHNKQIDLELQSIDEHWSMVEHPGAGDTLAVRHGCHQPRARFDGDTSVSGGVLPNEAVRGAGVDERDEVSRANSDPELDRVAVGNACDCV